MLLDTFVKCFLFYMHNVKDARFPLLINAAVEGRSS